MDEFELIRRYFTRASGDDAVLVNVGDDGAVLRAASGRDLVVVVDTLVEGVHYSATLAAEDIGYRAVAVNLSDIAAMGARPRWMTLALTLVQADPAWLAAFSRGLHAAADEFAVTLVGGDTTSGNQTVMSVQILGDVEADAAVLRSGARPGDCIFVSGTLGDAAKGLQLIEAGPASGPDREHLAARFRRPSARVTLGLRIASLVTAAIDVSDGLHADLSKLLDASECGGSIDVDRLPVSGQLQRIAGAAARRLALAGGDDYELCFTAPASAEAELYAIGGELGVRVTRIGAVAAGDRLICKELGVEVDYDVGGYVHFSGAKQ